MEQISTHDDAWGEATFSRVIRPHRSAGPRVLAQLLLLLAVPWTVASMVFVALGAWPVSAFFGLEAFLLGGAFWLNHRSAHAFEAIGLTSGELIVERVDAVGRRRSWSFQPGWLRLRPLLRNGRHTGIELRSHGRRLIIGSFLPPDDIPRLAADLGRAIHRLTAPAERQEVHQPKPSTSSME